MTGTLASAAALRFLAKVAAGLDACVASAQQTSQTWLLRELALEHLPETLLMTLQPPVERMKQTIREGVHAAPASQL